MNYEGGVRGIWCHSEAALSDELAQMEDIVRYATLALSRNKTQPLPFRIDKRYMRQRHSVLGICSELSFIQLHCLVSNGYDPGK